MRNRPVIIVTALVVAAGLAATIWAFMRPTHDEIVNRCQKAIDSSATKTHRPDACKDLSQDDYDTLLMGWALENAMDGMSKKDRDTLDYFDDGSINGSTG
jgi:hypothetical protein